MFFIASISKEGVLRIDLGNQKTSLTYTEKLKEYKPKIPLDISVPDINIIAILSTQIHSHFYFFLVTHQFSPRNWSSVNCKLTRNLLSSESAQFKLILNWLLILLNFHYGCQLYQLPNEKLVLIESRCSAQALCLYL